MAAIVESDGYRDNNATAIDNVQAEVALHRRPRRR